MLLNGFSYCLVLLDFRPPSRAAQGAKAGHRPGGLETSFCADTLSQLTFLPHRAWVFGQEGWPPAPFAFNHAPDNEGFSMLPFQIPSVNCNRGPTLCVESNGEPASRGQPRKMATQYARVSSLDTYFDDSANEVDRQHQHVRERTSTSQLPSLDAEDRERKAALSHPYKVATDSRPPISSTGEDHDPADPRSAADLCPRRSWASTLYNSWFWEVTLLFVSTVALAAVVILLFHWNEKPLSRWPSIFEHFGVYVGNYTQIWTGLVHWSLLWPTKVDLVRTTYGYPQSPGYLRRRESRSSRKHPPRLSALPPMVCLLLN